MNVQQPIIPTITTLPNVSILGNQPMNPSISHMVIFVSHEHNLSPLVTPFVPKKLVPYLYLLTQCGIMSYPFTFF
jgi:hypothetical protein